MRNQSDQMSLFGSKCDGVDKAMDSLLLGGLLHDGLLGHCLLCGGLVGFGGRRGQLCLLLQCARGVAVCSCA